MKGILDAPYELARLFVPNIYCSWKKKIQFFYSKSTIPLVNIPNVPKNTPNAANKSKQNLY